jgi:hypothetical protein
MRLFQAAAEMDHGKDAGSAVDALREGVLGARLVRFAHAAAAIHAARAVVGQAGGACGPGRTDVGRRGDPTSAARGGGA